MKKEERRRREIELSNMKMLEEQRYEVLVSFLVDYDVTEENLKSRSVIQLRVFALAGKVQNAIIMNKEPLIEKLMQIKEGTNAVYESSTKGRKCILIDAFEAQIAAFKIEIEEKEEIIFKKPDGNPIGDSGKNAVPDTLKDQIEVIDDLGKTKVRTIKGTVNTEVLEILEDGDGYLRGDTLSESSDDVLVPRSTIQECGLRNGDQITTKTSLKSIISLAPDQIHKVNELSLKALTSRQKFNVPAPIYPNKKFFLGAEEGQSDTIRAIDLMCPIGKGQRALIVAPPHSGKTKLIKEMANAIEKNNNEVSIFVLLIDETPEEVTEMKRSIVGSQIIHSTFEMSPKMHIRKAELLLDRAKRIVETGNDVVIFLDSISKLARAYENVEIKEGGSFGEISYSAVQKAKQFFASARNIEGKGSLTIIAAIQTESGSKTDEMIFEEFNGVGNLEIHLDKSLAEKRISTSISFSKSITKMNELLQTEEEMKIEQLIREKIKGKSVMEGTAIVLDLLKKAKSNKELYEMMAESLKTKEE